MNKRLNLLFAMFFLLFTILIFRLFYLQVLDSVHYRNLSQSNAHLNIEKAAFRANILDRNGVILATSTPVYKIIFYGTEKEFSYIRNKLEKLGITKSNIEYQTLVFKNLSWLQLSNILQLEALPMPEITVSQRRNYLQGPCAAHIIGYVMKEGVGLIGKTGVEKFLDVELKGVSGEEKFLINAKRRQLNKVKSKESIRAPAIKISIDAELQKYSYEVLSEHISGAGMVIDVNTGEILSAVSHPSFDPMFVDKKLDENCKEHKLNPQYNLFLNGTYPPASVMKPFAFLAALEQGIAKECFCDGSFYLGSYRFKCWRAHGCLPLSRVLPESCDVTFYSWSRNFNPHILNRVWKVFGFGEPVLKEIGGKNGFFPKVTNRWKAADSLFMQIGQGGTALTIAELTRAFGRIASGKKVDLTVINQNKKFEDLEINKENLAQVRKALFEVVNTPGGTAFGIYKSLGISGKTGTSQVRKMKEHEYGKGNMFKPWKERDHALFCGFAPFENPRIAACVIIVHGGSGGRFAAPVAMKMMEKALELTKEK